MKKLTKIQKERVEQFKKTLNKTSKFYNEDLQNFIDNVLNESVAQSKETLSRIGSYSDKSQQKQVEKEIEKMDKAGMFNPSKMHILNSLD